MGVLLELLIRMTITTICAALFTYIIMIVFNRYQRSVKAWHRIPKPVFGGLAIYFAFWINYGLALPELSMSSMQMGIFLASSIIIITGVIDDWIDIKPWAKSIGIILAAHIVYQIGEVSFATNIFAFLNSENITVGSYFLTIIWIYFVTNAINLLDGIDGLASSVSIVSLIAMVLITVNFSLNLQIDFVMMLLFLIAAIMGFWFFNWPPAKIMLGDTGALFIGFMYATLTVSNLKNATIYSFIFPVLLYAVPLFDTLFAFARRLVQGSPVTQGDQDHVHHRLLRKGWSEKQINGLMVLLTSIFSLLAYFLQAFPQYRIEVLLMTGLFIFLLIIFMIRIGKTE